MRKKDVIWILNPFLRAYIFFTYADFLYSHCILMEQETYVLSQVFYKDEPQAEL